MGKIGVIAEGEYDLPVLRTLIQKSLGHHVSIVTRSCHGEGNVIKLAPSLLAELSGIGEIEKVFVVRDLGPKGATSFNQLKKEIENRLGAREYSFPVKVAIMVKEMEAWLLADEKALSEITGTTVQRFPDPDTIQQPKDRLKSLLSNAIPTKLPYTPREAEDIAKRVRIDMLKKRSRSFRDFYESIHDC